MLYIFTLHFLFHLSRFLICVCLLLASVFFRHCVLSVIMLSSFCFLCFTPCYPVCQSACMLGWSGEAPQKGGVQRGHSHVRHVSGQRRRCQCKSATAVGRVAQRCCSKSCITSVVRHLILIPCYITLALHWCFNWKGHLSETGGKVFCKLWDKKKACRHLVTPFQDNLFVETGRAMCQNTLRRRFLRTASVWICQLFCNSAMSRGCSQRAPFIKINHTVRALAPSDQLFSLLWTEEFAVIKFSLVEWQKSCLLHHLFGMMGYTAYPRGKKEREKKRAALTQHLYPLCSVWFPPRCSCCCGGWFAQSEGRDWDNSRAQAELNDFADD